MSEVATAAAVPDVVPPGLDARPVIRYTVHCSHCGNPHVDDEFGAVTAWPVEALADLGAYEHFDEAGWEHNLDGRILVCGECASANGWCDTCGNQIRAWEEHGTSPGGSTFHTSCGAPTCEACDGKGCVEEYDHFAGALIPWPCGACKGTGTL